MLQYAIAAKEMDQIMSRLHRLFNIRITFFDMREHELEYFHVKPMSPFCTAFRRNKKRAQRCIECDREHLKEAKRLRDVHIYHCHCGLIEGIIPLYDRRNIYLGAIVFGQLRDLQRKSYTGWPPAFKQLYRKLPVFAVEKALDIGHVLKCVSKSIIDSELIRYQTKPWVEEIETYIETRLTEKIMIDQLAELIGKSPSFIAHHFKTEFGQTPQQYIINRRMEEARSMLENGSNVQTTAERLGFYDAFHFSKTFKRHWGFPPKQCLG
ncbi:MAG: PocR ligand-binding domain-containing protein [Kiritimatiellales bacterium]